MQARGPGGGDGRRRYKRAVGPRLRKLLNLVLALFAVLGATALYLGAVTATEAVTGETYQNYAYQIVFLAHLLLGLAIVVPVVVFGVAHMRRTYRRRNRRAVRVGYALFAVALALLASGVVLTRIENLIEVRDPAVREVAYWVHVVTPLLAAWLFVLHRLAGPRIRWRVGLTWAAVAGGIAVAMTALHTQDPTRWGVVGPASGERYFFPSLSRTSTGQFIPAETLANDAYCETCHADIHASWSVSARRKSSFNNPAYLFSVLETRRAVAERDGDVHASRFCAGCHDPVPFFSGAFDDPKFDDPDYDLASDPFAQAGITCTSCHAITHVNSVRGNADYTIEEPAHYPFAFSENRVLRWVNRQLVKAKPAFHKKTFLKDLHRSPEFCGSCHKVHLPPELNDYKWLRGQNHYDAYHLSGVSGHGVSSFYYPPKAEHSCNGCHMPLEPSDDFGARDFDATGALKVHDHQFPSANTALAHLLDLPDEVNEAHRRFNEGVMRLDLFGVRRGGVIDGPLEAPLEDVGPALAPGERVLFETVLRTMKMGHLFTQGTADSNEVWVELRVFDAGALEAGGPVRGLVGVTGGMAADGEVDPWSHFVNAFVLDAEGRRIDRRNAQDIVVALYDHQIPPGAADVVHYGFEVPGDVVGPLVVDAKLHYRKFDTTYLRYLQGERFARNDLPVLTLAADRVVFPIEGRTTSTIDLASAPPSPIVGEVLDASAPPGDPVPEWMRFNDYGIGLLRKSSRSGTKGQLRQAEEAFARVEALGRPDGPLNLARVYLREGRLDDAADALARAVAHDPPAPVWSTLWFTGQVDRQNGYLDAALESFGALVTLDTAETRRRELDFSQDYRLTNALAQTLFERAKQERGEDRLDARRAFLEDAASWYRRSLALDPENLEAHYGLALVLAQLGEPEAAAEHREAHATYKPDDNARDRIVAEARRRYPAADHAAEAVVIYDLQRDGAYGRAHRHALALARGDARPIARKGERP